MAAKNAHRLQTLSKADISRSFLKSLQCKNRNDEINNTKKVIQFIDSHIDDTNPETLYLIDCNLSFLGSYLGNFYFRKTDGGDIIAPNIELQQRRNGELLWIKCDLHKLAMKIIKKYQETKWIEKNGKIIFSALQIMRCLLLGGSKEVLKKITTQTEIIKVALEILSCKENENNITFIERFACIQMLNYYISSDSNDIFMEMLQKYNLNVAQLLIKECCNCFRLQFFYYNLKQYQKDILIQGISPDDAENIQNITSYQQIPTYMRSDFSNTDEYTKQIQKLAFLTRIESIKSIRALASHSNPNTISVFFNEKDVSAKYLKRLLQQTMTFMRQGKQTFPPDPNTIDIVVKLATHKFIAKRLVSDPEIIELLMIGLRSRAFSGEFNYREIVSIMYHIVSFRLLPRKYFEDLIFVLMDLIEMQWKNFSLAMECMPLLCLNTMIFRMLKYLFGVKKFENSKKEKYQCSICQDILNAPHTVQCGHSFCYGCLTMLIGASQTMNDKLYNRRRSSQCPLCRSVVEGEFDRDETKSAFVLDVKLKNKMYAEKIVFVNDYNEEKAEFVGNECEYWKYLESHGIDKLFDNKMRENAQIKAEFIRFCKFMQKQTQVFGDNENIKQIQKEEALKAKTVKLEGNAFFKQQKYQEALEKYQEALNICPVYCYVDRVIYYSNITLTLIKMKNYCDAFRAALSGLLINPMHIKLLNNCIDSMNSFLKCKNGIKRLHPFIKVNESNTFCPNRRLYDIILCQLIWDFELQYLRPKLLAQSNNAQQDFLLAEKLRKTDKLIVKNNRIQYTIPNFMPINFDEYQFTQYICRKNELKYKIRNEINSMIENKEMTEQTINDLMNVISIKFKETKEQSILNNLMQNKPEFISIILRMKNLRIEGENIIVQVEEREEDEMKIDKNAEDEIKNTEIDIVNEEKEQQDVKADKNEQNDIHEETSDSDQQKSKEKEIRAMNEWKYNDEDIIHCNVYIWDK